MNVLTHQNASHFYLCIIHECVNLHFMDFQQYLDSIREDTGVTEWHKIQFGNLFPQHFNSELLQYLLNLNDRIFFTASRK